MNGVCDPLHAFARGNFGPPGEDVRHRLVLAGTVHIPGGFELSGLSQAESARPYTMTTPEDVNGVGDSLDDRAVINGVQTALDQFRGTPYIQTDVRISRPFRFHERWQAAPFIEMFNLFNRNNPGANFVTDLAALPTPVNDLTNATAFCLNADCSQTRPITNLNQLRVPAGGLGDFFWSRNHGGNPVRGASRSPAKLLANTRVGPLADGFRTVHTPSMTLKSAALFALIGMVLLSIVLLVSFVNTLVGVVDGIVPAITLVTSFIHALAGLSVTVFFYVFHRAQ